MLLAGLLWLGTSSSALIVGGEPGTLLLGISSNLLVFYGFYQAWVRQAQDEEEFHEHELEEEKEHRSLSEQSHRQSRSRSRSGEEESQLGREAGR